MRWDTWKIVSKNSVADHNMLPENGLSSSRGNLIGRLEYPRNKIV